MTHSSLFLFDSCVAPTDERSTSDSHFLPSLCFPPTTHSHTHTHTHIRCASVKHFGAANFSSFNTVTSSSRGCHRNTDVRGTDVLVVDFFAVTATSMANMQPGRSLPSCATPARPVCVCVSGQTKADGECVHALYLGQLRIRDSVCVCE